MATCIVIQGGVRQEKKLDVAFHFVEGLIHNDEKVASPIKHFQFKTRMKKPYPV